MRGWIVEGWNHSNCTKTKYISLVFITLEMFLKMNNGSHHDILIENYNFKFHTSVILLIPSVQKKLRNVFLFVSQVHKIASILKLSFNEVTKCNLLNEILRNKKIVQDNG